MDQVRRILASVAEQLKKLSPSHKLAMASVALLLVTVMLVVAQWTGKPDLVDLLPTASAQEVEQAKVALVSAGFEVVPKSGKLMVRSADQVKARAVLAQTGQMPRDKQLLFETLIEKNSWTNSRQQNEMNFLNALMNELALTIGSFKGVDHAKVLIDVPEAVGLGAAVRRPTASATVWTDTGEAMPQSMVDAVASFIAGSRAGLDVSRVKVIDGSTGRQRKVTTDEDAMASSYLEHAAKVESQTQEKVMGLLAFIPDVIVAVTAQVDVTKVTTQTQKYLPEDQGSVVLTKKETAVETTSQDAAPGGEPGPASNVQADINRGLGGGSRTASTETTVENETRAGVSTESVIDPKGHPTMVAVSVNVPRRFVAGLVQPAAGGAEAAASKQQIEDEFKDLQSVIRNMIRPQVRAMTVAANAKADPKAIDALVDQSISVSLIPDMPRGEPGPQQAGLLGSLASGSGGGGRNVLGVPGGLIEKGVLGLLGVFALGMMVVMVKKAGRKTDIPSAEELVGLPPTLDAQADIIGEAAEGEMAMEGIEVGDDQMQSQQLLQTVSQMVQENPQSAAKMLNRWINVED
ncbi:MAG TPA: flagellar M-ring protein FliF C-terminal domain-containing protein [Phycisphaerales bacterium]|nr:flagellar M-ring protein FliF C-terminal domain-containing protein [Phycisphaerales bacterium]